MLPGLIPAGFGAKRDVKIAFAGAASNGADQSSYAFASQSIGAASADRIVIVGVYAAAVASVTTSVAVGGNTATQIVEANVGAFTSASIHALALPTGTAADIVVSLSGSGVRCAIAVSAMTGASGVAAFQSLSATTSASSGHPSVNLDIPANGAAFAMAVGVNAASATWSGLTETADAVLETTRVYTAADLEFAGAQTDLAITATFNAVPASSVLAAASWGPW